jgi:hypothetical protein
MYMLQEIEMLLCCYEVQEDKAASACIFALHTLCDTIPYLNPTAGLGCPLMLLVLML